MSLITILILSNLKSVRPWPILHDSSLTGVMLVLAKALDLRDEARSRQELGKAVQGLFKRFKELRGTTLSRDLLDADMSTPEGAAKIRDEHLVKRFCCSHGRFGQEVSEILEDMLALR